MTRLLWSSPETRMYEAGVQKGVLYVEGELAVPWTGLVSVTHTKADAEENPTYLDGLKWARAPRSGEFEANITAFTYPELFDTCIGYSELAPGAYIDEQPPRQFNLSYQTLKGGGTKGTKQHIIYNAIAIPGDVEYQTIGESVEPSLFSWALKTIPEDMLLPGVRPSSHLVLDSTRLSDIVFDSVIDILHGSTYQEARMLYPEELTRIIQGTIYQ